jgi:hypothetical protein
MNRNSLTTAVIAGIAGVAGIANMAGAVNLNPDGLGQVLLYPYYTVNGGQQTVLSVVNTTDVGKAVKVRFLEGYNSREVLDFNLFLSPFDVWVASVFSLSDAGISGAGAAITTNDNSCTAPQFTQGTVNGHGYQSFLNYAYTGTYADTGPTGTDRTREGHFEIISMADIVTDSDLYVDTKHVDGLPPGCAAVSSGGKTQAEIDFEADDEYTIPTSGLFGSAGPVNVAQGTYYSYNADALDGFTATALATPTGSLSPSLSDVNDANPTTATSYVFDDGALLTSTYTAGGSTGIDAVSSVFMASNIYNEYITSGDGSAGTDWVVTFPTKRFYVDPLYTNSETSAIIPFEEVFGEGTSGPGLSCTEVAITIYDREENTSTPGGCGFSPCPPGQPPSSLCHETNVITFDSTGTSSVLDSTLTSNILPIGTSGWLGLGLLTSSDPAHHPHNLRPAANGNVFHGLPITGFQATDFVNNDLGGVLSNYSGVNRHRISRSCTNGAGNCS